MAHCKYFFQWKHRNAMTQPIETGLGDAGQPKGRGSSCALLAPKYLNSLQLIWRMKGWSKNLREAIKKPQCSAGNICLRSAKLVSPYQILSPCRCLRPVDWNFGLSAVMALNSPIRCGGLPIGKSETHQAARWLPHNQVYQFQLRQTKKPSSVLTGSSQSSFMGNKQAYQSSATLRKASPPWPKAGRRGQKVLIIWAMCQHSKIPKMTQFLEFIKNTQWKCYHSVAKWRLGDSKRIKPEFLCWPT